MNDKTPLTVTWLKLTASDINIDLDRTHFDPTNIKLTLIDKDVNTVYTLNLEKLVEAGLLTKEIL